MTHNNILITEMEHINPIAMDDEADTLEPKEIVGKDGLIHTCIKVSRSDDEVDESDHDGINLDDEFAMALAQPQKEEDDEEEADDASLTSSALEDASSSSSEQEVKEEEEENEDLRDAENETVVIDSNKKRKRVASSNNGVKRFKHFPRNLRIIVRSEPLRKRDEYPSQGNDSDDEDSEDDAEIVRPQRGPNNLYDVPTKLKVLQYFETHTAKQTATKFGLTPKRIQAWERSKEKIEAESLGVYTRRPRGDNYTIEEKLQAIAFSEQHSICEAQLLYGVHKRTIEKWKQKKAQMEAIIHEGFGTRKRRGGGGRNPLYPHIENDLRDWIIALRLQGVTVNNRMILNKAKALLEKDASSQHSTAPSTITWVLKFLGRHNLVGQLGTTLGEEDPHKLLAQIPGNHDQNSFNKTTENFGQVEIPENPNQRNRRTITLDDKVSIIERIQRGETQSNVARTLNVAQSTIQTIWTSKNQILERYQDPERKAKIVHWKKYSDIDNALHNWYVDGISKHLQIDGEALTAKAIEFCEMFNKPEFKHQVNKWTAIFCKKHGIQNLAVQPEPAPATQTDSNTATEQKDPVVSNKDDYVEFFLTNFPPSASSCENYDTAQTFDVQVQPNNLSSLPLNILQHLTTEPQPNLSNDTTKETNNHVNNPPVSTIDALKYIGLLRSWVHSSFGANGDVLNNHLNALENVALKRQLADMTPLLPKKYSVWEVIDSSGSQSTA